MNKKILITGGAGFIGSALIRYIISKTLHSVCNLDKLTYAGNLDSLKQVKNTERYFFKKIDICDAKKVKKIFHEYKPEIIIHLAAQAGVRYSIQNPDVYLNTNILGTFNVPASHPISAPPGKYNFGND